MNAEAMESSTRSGRPRCSLASQFLAGRLATCEDPSILAGAVCDLQERLEAGIAAEDFNLCRESLRAVEAARAQLLMALKKRNQQEAKDRIAAKKSATQREFAEVNAKLSERAKGLELTLRQRSESLAARQARDRELQDTEWRTVPESGFSIAHLKK
jgi:hypothetical protein